jgi:hypothetical protein
VEGAALPELAVLPRSEEVAEPSQLAPLQRRVELVPEDQGKVLLQHRVAHLVEGRGQLMRGFELGKVELEGPDAARDLLADRLLHGERLACARRAEHRH